MNKLQDFYQYLELSRNTHLESWHNTGDTHHLHRFLELEHVIDEFKATIKALELDTTK